MYLFGTVCSAIGVYIYDAELVTGNLTSNQTGALEQC